MHPKKGMVLPVAGHCCKRDTLRADYVFPRMLDSQTGVPEPAQRLIGELCKHGSIHSKLATPNTSRHCVAREAAFTSPAAAWLPSKLKRCSFQLIIPPSGVSMPSLHRTRRLHMAGGQ
jgi:hypothetical protein